MELKDNLINKLQIEEITPAIEESAEVLGDSEAQPEPEIEVIIRLFIISISR